MVTGMLRFGGSAEPNADWLSRNRHRIQTGDK
jgi:hypothetical protein